MGVKGIADTGARLHILVSLELPDLEQPLLPPSTPNGSATIASIGSDEERLRSRAEAAARRDLHVITAPPRVVFVPPEFLALLQRAIASQQAAAGSTSRLSRRKICIITGCVCLLGAAIAGCVVAIVMMRSRN